jgi:hypothetical protein
MKNIDVGFGSMIYTVIYQDQNGDIRHNTASGSHDRSTAMRQTQKKFKKVLALIPGSHQVVLGHKIS